MLLCLSDVIGLARVTQFDREQYLTSFIAWIRSLARSERFSISSVGSQLSSLSLRAMGNATSEGTPWRFVGTEAARTNPREGF